MDNYIAFTSSQKNNDTDDNNTLNTPLSVAPPAAPATPSTTATSRLASVFSYDLSEPSQPPPRQPVNASSHTTSPKIQDDDTIINEAIQDRIVPSKGNDNTTATTDMAVSLIHASDHSRLFALQAVNTTLTHIANDPVLQVRKTLIEPSPSLPPPTTPPLNTPSQHSPCLFIFHSNIYNDLWYEEPWPVGMVTDLTPK